MNDFPAITLLTFLPVIGAIAAVSCGPRRRVARAVAIGSGAFTLAAALLLAISFGAKTTGFAFEERHKWIPSLSVDYHVGVDGLGVTMVLLAALVTLMSILAARDIVTRSSLYYGMVLLLCAGLIGTFTALNFFHWFVFWELSLVPAFFLVRLWGGSLRAEAATRFFVYTMVGSVAMLLGFVAIYLATGDFSFVQLAKRGASGGVSSALEARASWLPGAAFAGILIGFLVKVPVVPFHGWLPMTYSQAPASTTMLLTGAMSKMGAYGLLRILLPIFPDQVRAWSTPLLWLAVISIIYSAAVAMAQTDLRRLLAFSSINHLGYCVLALFAAFSVADMPQFDTAQVAALSGAVFQMFNHGLTAAALFWMAGFLECRTGTLDIREFGGLGKVMPGYTALMGIALFSSLGLPGLNGFVGEFLIFKGVLALAPISAVCSVAGLLFTAVFLLGLAQRLFTGPLDAQWKTLPDLDPRERMMLLGPIGLMICLGVYPQALAGLINSTVLLFARGT